MKLKTNRKRISSSWVQSGGREEIGYNFTFLSLVGCTADCIAFQLYRLCVCFDALQLLEPLLNAPSNRIAWKWRVNWLWIVWELRNCNCARSLGTATACDCDCDSLTAKANQTVRFASILRKNFTAKNSNAKRNWYYVSAGNRNSPAPPACYDHDDGADAVACRSQKSRRFVRDAGQAQFQFAVCNSQCPANEIVTLTASSAHPFPAVIHFHSPVSLKCNMKLWVRCGCLESALFAGETFLLTLRVRFYFDITAHGN